MSARQHRTMGSHRLRWASPQQRTPWPGGERGVMSSLPHPLTATHPVQDPIHGRIWLTDVELAIVDTGEFQRLRHISQLSPVDLVFPGATHDRFSHSIGAAHVMGLILSQKPFQDHFCKYLERPDYIQLLRLAALLHDVGHMPFSHVGETAWHAASASDAFSYINQEGFTVFDAAAGASSKSLHESLSELVITESQIASIIDKEVAAVDGEAASHAVAAILAGRQTDLVAHNLLSSDLDCDRLDYLLRDSMTAGLVYGNIDLAYLVGNLVVAEDPGGRVLAIDGKHGRMAGEHFLLARYFHYAQFISHKTVASAEVDLIAAMLELIRLDKLPSHATLFSRGSGRKA